MLSIDPSVIEVIKLVASVAGVVASGIGTVVVLARPYLAPFTPLLEAFIRKKVAEMASAEGAAVFATLERAIKPGLSAAVIAMQAEADKAVRPDSEDGVLIGRDEYARILKAGADAVCQVLKAQGGWDAAIRALGSEKVLLDSIQVLLQRGLKDKHSVTQAP